jgi:hypothetical protein
MIFSAKKTEHTLRINPEVPEALQTNALFAPNFLRCNRRTNPIFGPLPLWGHICPQYPSRVKGCWLLFCNQTRGVLMIFSAKKKSGHTLRINPEVLEVLRRIAPLPDLNGVRLVAEKEPAPIRAPAPKHRFKFKIPFLAEGEAEGLFGITAFVMVLMVFAVVVVVLERT